jgi:repressor LexA
LLDRDTNVSYNRVVKEITGRQKQILDFIADFAAEAGVTPTVREVASRLGITIGPAQRHLKALIAKGYLKHRAGISRGIDLALRAPQFSVPILGRVPAGSPVPPLEDVEGHVHIDRHAVGKGNYFALKVRGDSMTGAGIFEDDVVVVRQQETAEHGDIVVALAGGEATVKRLHRKGKDVWLEPANPKYKPIHSKDIRIAGKVVYLTRKI